MAVVLLGGAPPPPTKPVKKKLPPLFATEAELCAAFIAWASKRGWKAYAECNGWDVLLVSLHGVQLGVQAKLKFNMKVLSQALSGDCDWLRGTQGPDYRAILVAEPGNSDITRALGLGLFSPVDERIYHGCKSSDPISFMPQLPDWDEGSIFYTESRRVGRHPDLWHDWNPEKRCTLPEYVPDSVAGSPSPVTLSPWKIKALRICALLELRGWVTREDFKRLGVHHQIWMGQGGWLEPTGAMGRWRATPRLNIAEKHPVVYQQIKSEMDAELRAASDTLKPAGALI